MAWAGPEQVARIGAFYGAVSCFLDCWLLRRGGVAVGSGPARPGPVSRTGLKSPSRS